MRLKKLKLHGFKSFADEVTLHFDVDLIALVGPNGCGKSNIVDAFRWVIGEQSAKSMRADKMNDVIFAGSERRKPLNYAEVSLHLSEVSHPLIPFDEVVISRRLYRSGESEYLINKEPCRLKDIQSLFFGSGVGKNAISIFEQGKLDQIIYLSPIERRALFDETAGINRFLQRKKETQKRLDEVTMNYGRLKDLHSEVEKRQKQLKKQAEEAKHYQANKEELELLEKQLMLSRFKKLEEMMASLRNEKEPLALETNEAKEAFAAYEKSEEELRKKLFEKEREVKSSQERIYGGQSGHKIKCAEEKREQEKITELGLRKKKLKQTEEEDEKELATLKKMVKSALEQHEKRAIEKRKIEETHNEVVKIHGEAYEKQKLLQTQEHAFQKEQFLILAEESQLDKKLQEKSLRKENFKKESERLNKAIHDIKRAKEKSCDDIEEKRKEVDQSSKELVLAKQALDKALLELKEGAAELKELALKKEPIAKAIQLGIAKESALKSLIDEGSKHLLQESQKRNSPLYGMLRPLYEVFSAKKSSVHLLSAILKTYAETLVVKSKEEARVVLEYAEGKKWSDFSLLVADGIENLPNNFSDVDDLDHLLKKCGKKGREVQLDEKYVVDHNGVLFKIGELEKSSSFTRHAEILELKEEIALQQIELMKLEKIEGALLQKRDHLEKERVILETAWRKKEMALMGLNFTLQQLITLEKNQSQEQQQKEKELKSLLENLESCESEMEKISRELVQKQKQIKEREGALKVRDGALQSAAKEEEKALLKKNESAEKLHAVMEMYRAEESELKILTMKEQMKNESIQKHAQEDKYLDEELIKSKGKLKELQAEVAALSMKVVEAEEVGSQVQKESLALHMQLEGLQKGLTRERKRVQDLETKAHRLEVTTAEMRSKSETIVSEFTPRFQITMEEALASTPPLALSTEEATKKVQKLRVEVESQSMINLGSIEELQIENERFSNLGSQLQDLHETKEDLERLTKSIEQESRKLFKETFETVRAHFQKNFQLLFNGGRADLKFTESSDILEAGIDIIAEPPGKQMRSISLLSGGEKCMTALALLFSIFQYKPAPFCILDEVDAPLDDANVGRFTTMLREFVGKTQFIIVTHNKKTMAIADILFGVSMEEKGVSRLLSLEFEKKLVTTH